MLKKIIENSFYRHFDTTEVDKSYRIKNYITPHIEPFRIMRKHQQAFQLKILWFKKVIWYTTKLEVMEFPRDMIGEFAYLGIERNDLDDYKLPLQDELRESLFVPMLYDGRFTIASVYYGKKYENGDVKVLKVDYMDLVEIPIVDIESITVTNKVITALADMAFQVEFMEEHLIIEEEENGK